MHPRTVRSKQLHTKQRSQTHQRLRLKGALLALLLGSAAVAGCESEKKGPMISKTPASVRGWLVNPAAGEQQILHLTDTASGEAAHRARAFEQTHLSVQGFPYASGGMAGDGSFIILDVPPGDVIINFQPPQGLDAQLVLQGVPPNADVLLPALQMEGTRVVPADPSRLVVRVPARVSARREIASPTSVAGQKVKLFEVPLAEMVDRRDFPQPNPR